MEKKYNPENAKKQETVPKLKPDSILDGVVVAIEEGKVLDFVKHLDKWNGASDQPAIQVIVEVPGEGEVVRIEKLFTHGFEEGTNAILYHEKSNMGKYEKKYGNIPKVGDKVKVITNSEGFGKVMIE